MLVFVHNEHKCSFTMGIKHKDVLSIMLRRSLCFRPIVNKHLGAYVNDVPLTYKEIK